MKGIWSSDASILVAKTSVFKDYRSDFNAATTFLSDSSRTCSQALSWITQAITQVVRSAMRAPLIQAMDAVVVAGLIVAVAGLGIKAVVASVVMDETVVADVIAQAVPTEGYV